MASSSWQTTATPTCASHYNHVHLCSCSHVPHCPVICLRCAALARTGSCQHATPLRIGTLSCSHTLFLTLCGWPHCVAACRTSSRMMRARWRLTLMPCTTTPFGSSRLTWTVSSQQPLAPLPKSPPPARPPTSRDPHQQQQQQPAACRRPHQQQYSRAFCRSSRCRCSSSRHHQQQGRCRLLRSSRRSSSRHSQCSRRRRSSSSSRALPCILLGVCQRRRWWGLLLVALGLRGLTSSLMTWVLLRSQAPTHDPATLSRTIPTG